MMSFFYQNVPVEGQPAGIGQPGPGVDPSESGRQLVLEAAGDAGDGLFDGVGQEHYAVSADFLFSQEVKHFGKGGDQGDGRHRGASQPASGWRRGVDVDVNPPDTEIVGHGEHEPQGMIVRGG